MVVKRRSLKVSALHFYESKRLIRSWRNQGSQRRFNKDVLLIKAAQKMGVSLAEIKEELARFPTTVRQPKANGNACRDTGKDH